MSLQIALIILGLLTIALIIALSRKDKSSFLHKPRYSTANNSLFAGNSNSYSSEMNPLERSEFEIDDAMSGDELSSFNRFTMDIELDKDTEIELTRQDMRESASLWDKFENTFDDATEGEFDEKTETESDDETHHLQSSVDAEYTFKKQHVEPVRQQIGQNGQVKQTMKKEATQKVIVEDEEPIEGFARLSQIDYWAKISGSKDISHDVVVAIYKEVNPGLMKYHNIYGLRIPQNIWVDIEGESESTRFTDLVLTIQLSDRQGAISKKELGSFNKLVHDLAERIGRNYIFMASAENALLQAERLQIFRENYKKLYMFTIIPEEDDMKFEGPLIDRFARQLGLEQAGNGHYHRTKRVGKQDKLLYSLANLGETGQFDFNNITRFKTDGLVFFTKPAINCSSGAVFNEMADTAKAIAYRLKGKVMIPGLADIRQDNVDNIRKSIEVMTQEMESRGMEAGSDEAIRLFK